MNSTLMRAALILDVATFTSMLRATEFPLRLNSDHRHLVDQRGVPFLCNADKPWMIFLKLTEDEGKESIGNRNAKGFKALQVQLTGFLSMTNRARKLPIVGRWKLYVQLNGWGNFGNGVTGSLDESACPASESNEP